MTFITLHLGSLQCSFRPLLTWILHDIPNIILLVDVSAYDPFMGIISVLTQPASYVHRYQPFRMLGYRHQ
jgi:hypothetical protein